MTQLPLIDVTVEPVKPPPPPETTIYLVAAFRRTAEGGYWKIHRKSAFHDFPDFDAAQEHANALDGTWIEKRIIRVCLP